MFICIGFISASCWKYRFFAKISIRLNLCYAVVKCGFALSCNNFYSETHCYKYCRQMKCRFPNLKLFTDNSKNFVLLSSLQVNGSWLMNVTRSLRGSVKMGCHMTEKYWIWIFCVGTETYTNCLKILQSYWHFPNLELSDEILPPSFFHCSQNSACSALMKLGASTQTSFSMHNVNFIIWHQWVKLRMCI